MMTPAEQTPFCETEQDFIEFIPNWILRWGIFLLGLVFCMGLICTHYIRFPDVLKAQVMISAKEQPAYVSWYNSGSLTYHTPVEPLQAVTRGDTLLIEYDQQTQKQEVTLAPLSGRALLTKGDANNPKKNTLVIEPSITSIKVYAALPTLGAGQVSMNQKVNIYLDAYPADKFGIIEGRISYVSATLINQHYQAEIRLKKGLVTTTNFTIPKQFHLKGRAEILLEERSLLRRLIPF